MIDLLINRARSFIFSTAPAPAAAAAATAAVQWVASQEGDARRRRLWANVDQIKNGLIAARLALPLVRSAILPLPVGDERRAVEQSTALRARGIFLPAIRYPTVARGEARLRLTATAAHTLEDIQALLGAFTPATLAES